MEFFVTDQAKRILKQRGVEDEFPLKVERFLREVGATKAWVSRVGSNIEITVMWEREV